jgi:uncharacterized protein (UPF0332 family)
MFYSVQAILLTKNLSFLSHKGVISAFGEHFVKTGIFPREMGRELNRAFEKRQIGDYEYTFVISEEEAEEILANGKKFETTSKLNREKELMKHYKRKMLNIGSVHPEIRNSLSGQGRRRV